MKSPIAVLAILASTTSAARFILHIPTTQLVNPSTLPSTTHATLQSAGEPIDARLTRSNSFNFNNVSAGSYLAVVHCRDYAFEPLRIDVSLEEAVEGSGEKREIIRSWQTFIGNEWDNKGESRGEGGNGLVVEAKPLAPKHFYQERSGCEINLPATVWTSTDYDDSSLSAIISKESYDSHGSLLDGAHFRHAISYGE
jgi:ER membrane protein complex subunit 7